MKTKEIGGTVSSFLDKVTEKEKEALREQKQSAGGSPKFVDEMFDSLRRVFRKEMTTRVHTYENGKTDILLVPKAQYCVCPECMSPMTKAVWTDLGDERMIGPFCASCSTKAQPEFAHEEGMSYGGARFYSMEIDENFFRALAIWMSRQTEAPVEKIKRDPHTALPMEEEDDLIF